MSERVQQRYAPHNALALNPKAFGLLFDAHASEDSELSESGVAVVSIRGPLMHHADFFFDSYEAIKLRIAEALALEPKFVLLSIDSPGGLVSGAFDTARALRAMAIEAGIDLYAHVEGQATSAAYAIASAATWIGVSESGSIGSIGVIDTLISVSAQNAAMGLDVQVVTSGARKSDGNPAVEISEEALAARQRRVDTFAGMFFDLVTEHGWGGSRDRVEAMQASIVTGVQAVALGLATEVATFDQSLAFALPEAMRTGAGAKQTEEGRYNMAKATTEEDAVASLRKMAKSEDDDEARKAKAALKALGFGDDEETEGDDDDKDDDAKSEGDDDDDADAKAKAEGDDDDADAKAKAEGDDDDADAKAAASSTGATAMAEVMARVHNLETREANKTKKASRSALLAKRPDISVEMCAVLSDPKMSDKQVTKLLSKMDVGPTRKGRVAAAATATGVQGASQGDSFAAQLPPEEKEALDVAMGLAEMSTETVSTPYKLSFGVRRPVQKGKVS